MSLSDPCLFPLSLRADTEEDNEEEELRPLSRDELQKAVLAMVQ